MLSDSIVVTGKSDLYCNIRIAVGVKSGSRELLKERKKEITKVCNYIEICRRIPQEKERLQNVVPQEKKLRNVVT